MELSVRWIELKSYGINNADRDSESFWQLHYELVKTHNVGRV